MSTSDERVRVAVIGGGIAGITAAEALRARGYEVMVFEERFHLGGKLGAHPARVPLDQFDYSKVRAIMEHLDEHDSKPKSLAAGTASKGLTGVRDVQFHSTDSLRTRKRLGEVLRRRRSRLIRRLKSKTPLPSWMRAILIDHFRNRRTCLGLPEEADPSGHSFTKRFRFQNRTGGELDESGDYIWLQ